MCFARNNARNTEISERGRFYCVTSKTWTLQKTTFLLTTVWELGPSETAYTYAWLMQWNSSVLNSETIYSTFKLASALSGVLSVGKWENLGSYAVSAPTGRKFGPWVEISARHSKSGCGTYSSLSNAEMGIGYYSSGILWEKHAIHRSMIYWVAGGCLPQASISSSAAHLHMPTNALIARLCFLFNRTHVFSYRTVLVQYSTVLYTRYF